jgi:hypothetical protein
MEGRPLAAAKRIRAVRIREELKRESRIGFSKKACME